MDFLFGADMPLAVRFFFAFVIVLALIGGTAFLVRRFGGERLGASSARGRQPRLAVIDAAAVDGRRRLILIRRDNVEHLLMIGGPSDVVVEANIVRAAQGARDAAGRPQPAPADALPRPAAINEGNMWPLQPEPAPAPAPAPVARPQRIDEPMQWNEPEPPPLPLPPRRTETRPELRPEPRADMRPEPRAEMRPEPRAEMRPEPRPEPRADIRPEPRLTEMREPRQEMHPEMRPEVRPEPRNADPLAGLAAELARVQPEPTPGPKLRPPPRDREIPRDRDMPRERDVSRERDIPRDREVPRDRDMSRDMPRDRELPRARAPQPERPRTIVPPPPAPVDEPPGQDADQNLAEMAQRLEAALRRPKSTEPRAPEAPRGPSMSAPAANPMSMSDLAMPTDAAPHADTPSPAPQQAPMRGGAAKPQKSVYDSLEQEMASLLGRPNGKT